MKSVSVPRRAVAGLAALFLALPLLGAVGGGPVAQAAAVKDPAPIVNAFADFYPPAPFDQLLKQPDGTTFSARLTPAEIGASLEANGFTVTRGADQVWRYATGRSAAGELLASSVVVGRGSRPPVGVAPGVGRTKNVFTDSAGRDIRTETFRQLQIASRKAQLTAAAAGEVRTFKFPVLMLATWWDTSKGQSLPQFQDGTNTPGYFSRLLDGFGGNRHGTMTEFYYEDSFGQFLVQVDVFGPYTSAQSAARQDPCYYGGIEAGDDGGPDLDLFDDVLGIGGAGALGMATEVVPQADPDVDFAEYDNDGDTIVDFVGIVHSGADMAVTGDPCNTWSHAIQATLGATPDNADGIPTSDGVFVDRLFTMPEFNDATHPLTIGVATHEMAHALGEPDYYNTSYTSMGTGDWDIMSGGSYLGNPAGSNPSGFNPASRVFQGWIQPTVVTSDKPGTTLQPRHVKPAGYTVAQAHPGLVLVSVKEIAVGENDGTGYFWTERDTYGLPKNPKTGKFVIEGYYLENMNRTANAAPIHPDMTRSPYFDRQLLGSGIMAWHFDYWIRSNVYFGSNNAQNDANRPQMDVMEWDGNDNTQEQQLSTSRGNAEDLLVSATTGITSGTRLLPPGIPRATGPAQVSTPIAGVAAPLTPGDSPFVVTDNPNNYLMTVSAGSTNPAGDCTLQLLYEGKVMGSAVDSGGAGAPEVIRVIEPEPGNYTARVGDFAACGAYEGDVKFESSEVSLITKGAADTWSNWSQAPTGWAITRVGPGAFNELDHSADAGGSEAITLDIVKIGGNATDLSPGIITGIRNAAGGTGAVNVGRTNALQLPVFNNGGKAVASAVVQIRSGSRTGPVVATKTVTGLAPYSRKIVTFDYRAVREGTFDLFATVDPANKLAERLENNNTQQVSLWAGPAAPRVLVVDDDGAQDGEDSFTGALAALGVSYSVVGEHPDLATLRKYQAVLWETGGERYQGQLDLADRTALRGYLDNGGKVLVTGPRIADALGENPGRTNPGGSAEGQKFLKQYFGADYFTSAEPNNDDRKALGTGGVFGRATFEVGQLPGRHIVNELHVADYAAPVSDDTTAPAIGTVRSALAWQGARPGSLLGVSVTGDAEHKGFKTALLGFNLSQLTGSDQHVAAVRSALQFFGVPLGGYTVSSPEPVIYHSAVRNLVSGTPVKVRAVVLGGAANAPVTVFYRRHGKGGYYALPMTKGAAKGTWSAKIPGNAVTPDGVDYYLQAGTSSTFDPVLAANGSVAHAIGVALPEVAHPIAIRPITKPTKPTKPTQPAGGGLPATGLPGLLTVLGFVLLALVAVSRRLGYRAR